MLRRAPGFAVLCVLCLTLGIGANTAVFSWIESILLRPFPSVPNQDRLLVLGGTAHGVSRASAVSWPDFLDYRRSAKSIQSFIADRLVATTLSIGDRAERAPGSIVSANYFDALGVRPVLGRGFLPEEEFGRNAHPVVVISYQLWRERFGADPNVIGRTQLLNGLPHAIIGVAPPGFGGTFVGYAIQFWVPVSMQETFEPGGYKLEERAARWIEGFVMLKPGLSRAQAQAEISSIASHLEHDYPASDRGRGIALLPLWRSPFNGADLLLPTLSVALAAVGLVLLIACANVGNLLLVRSFARRHEITVRMSVGAGRWRVVRQLVTEGLLIAIIAAAGGLLLADWCRNTLALFFPAEGVALNLDAQIDLRVLTFCAAVCLVATLVFALAPAIQTARCNLVDGLKAETGGAIGGGRRRSLMRSGLILVQVSLSFVLLVGAGLLIQSLRAMSHANPGFSTREVLNASVDLFAAGYDSERGEAFQDALVDRVQALPGVQAAAFARVSPFTHRGYSAGPILVDGYYPDAEEQPSAEYDEIGPDYFRTFGIPLVAGREFTRADNEGSPSVAIINQTMAAHYWPGRNPVNQRVQVKGRWMQIIGVARDTKYRSFLEAPKALFYVPLRQNYSGQVTLHIRSRRAPETLALPLAAQVHALDPNLAVSAVSSMRSLIELSTSTQRIAVTLLAVFGGMALLLAAIGLYAVMSYVVSQSRRELALRMALGATATHLMRNVLSSGVILTLAGISVGTIAALGLTRLIAEMLYQVGPRDTVSFAAASGIVTAAGAAACLVPALRASRADPVAALRGE